MKIKGSLVFYHVQRIFPHSAYNSPSSVNELSVIRPMFWSKKQEMRGHLVVVDASRIGHLVYHYDETMFVCVGCSLEMVKNLPNECIVIEDKENIQEVFNRLLEIFDLISEWKTSLDYALTHLLSYDAIIRSCDNMIDDPLALVDSQFRYVGYSKRLAYENSFEDMYVGEGGFLLLEDINRLTAMPDFYELEKIKEPFQYSCVENCIHLNVFFEGCYIGRLALPFSDDPVKTAYYKQVLLVVAEYIEALYAKLATFWHRKPFDGRIKKTLTALLDGHYVDRENFESGMLGGNAGSEEQFILIQIKSHFTSNDDKLGDVLSAHLEELWPGSCCVVYHKKIVALVNLTRFNSLTKKLFSQELSYFLRESLLIAGMSRQFSDPLSVKAAYLQTEVALEMGEERNPTYWYFRFDDYAYTYLLQNGCGNFLPEQICHTGIEVLFRYDKTNRTELAITLYTFIKVNYNSVKAAKELGIARSSFIKRMERIRVLTGISLETFEERIYVTLSFELYREQGKKGQCLPSQVDSAV